MLTISNASVKFTIVLNDKITYFAISEPPVSDLAAKPTLIRAIWAGGTAKTVTWTTNEWGAFGYDASIEGKKGGLYLL